MMERHALRPAQTDFAAEIARHSGDRDVIYKRAGGEPLYLSLYEPPAYAPAAGRWPLVVLVHGGGWAGRRVFPDQAHWSGDYLGFLARLLAGRGCLCAAVDYRPMREGGQAPGSELIDLYEDCMDAADWLKARTETLGIDRENVTVLGESAGGYLAAAMAALPLRDTSFFTRAVLVNAITDLSDPRWRARVAENSAHPLLRGLSMPEKIARLSPADNLRPGVCPTLLLHGEADSVVFPFHAQKYHDLTIACGNSARIDWIERTGHAFLLAEYMNEQGKPLDAAAIGADCLCAWLGLRPAAEK